MRVESTSFEDGAWIPPRCALFQSDPVQHAVPAGNRSPALSWEDLPSGTEALAILCIDGDAPTEGHTVNREDAVVPRELPRTDFVHWLALGPVPHDSTSGGFEEGVFSNECRAGGKASPPGPIGWVQGANDYGAWFAGGDWEGPWLGYDGPGPPWNDDRVHHYRFEVVALPRMPVLQPGFTRPALEALLGEALGRASITGRYTQNPSLLPR